jgi:hypothetical protein
VIARRRLRSPRDPRRGDRVHGGAITPPSGLPGLNRSSTGRRTRDGQRRSRDGGVAASSLVLAGEPLAANDPPVSVVATRRARPHWRLSSARRRKRGASRRVQSRRIAYAESVPTHRRRGELAVAGPPIPGERNVAEERSRTLETGKTQSNRRRRADRARLTTCNPCELASVWANC